MSTKHRVITGDSREMQELDSNSVHLVITSPPYWQLKDYGIEQQIGYNDSYEEYINNLNLVWQECYRVLDNGCRLCVNIGDQFARSVYYGRYKVIPIRTEIIKFCESIGFDYMGAIIWQKKTTTNTTGGASIMGSFPYPRNGILSIDYEFILLFKKLGTPAKIDRERKENSKLTKEEWKEYFSGHWNFGGARQQGHIAMFPEELPHRLIKMFAFEGDYVLDPFLGSGTTSLASFKLNRNSVGYEINPEFVPIIKERLHMIGNDLMGSQITFEQQKFNARNIPGRIEELPYRFVDPIAVSRKTDPKQLSFGSKIDSETRHREEYFTIKEIISPELIKLNKGLKVRLIGVKENKELTERAIRFLFDKTKSQKVFLRFDDIKHDKENNLLGYLYLKNKTFLNAHLIKNGLVFVDNSYEYQRKKMFQELEGNGIGKEYR